MHDDKSRELLRSLAVLSVVLLYFFICDRTNVFAIGKKSYSRDVFVFLILMVMGFSLTSLKSTSLGSLMNRDLTEEWKGWMQIIFLAYHYFNAKEIYNVIRVLIAAYVWLTGFGHVYFFRLRGNYGWDRVFKMLFRLNFLVILVCLIMNTEYMLYYICAMHTCFFMLVYCTMVFKQSWNVHNSKLVIKILLAALVVFFIWDVLGADGKEGAFYLFWSPLQPILQKTEEKYPSMHEWWFRTKLDHFAPVWGMFYAMWHPTLEKYLDELERRPGYSGTMIKSGIVGVCSIIFYWWVTSICSLEDRVSYNQLHPYFSFIPIFFYILIRNISATARKYYCHILSVCGKITLETYIAQFHIFLTSDTKTLLVLVPDYPLVNAFVVTVIYVWASFQVFHITSFLAEYLIPNDFSKFGKTWGTMIGVFMIGYIFNGLFIL